MSTTIHERLTASADELRALSTSTIEHIVSGDDPDFGAVRIAAAEADAILDEIATLTDRPALQALAQFAFSLSGDLAHVTPPTGETASAVRLRLLRDVGDLAALVGIVRDFLSETTPDDLARVLFDKMKATEASRIVPKGTR